MQNVKYILKRTILFFLIYSLDCVGQAASSDFTVHPFYSIGMDFGGQDFSNLSNGKVKNEIAAGKGGIGNFGLAVKYNNTFEVRFFGGYNFWQEKDGENSTRWQSFPINLEYLGVYEKWNLKYGIGGTYRVANSLESENTSVKDTIIFENNFAFTVPLEFYVDTSLGQLGIGVRYTGIDYVESTTQEKFEGRSFMISINLNSYTP